MRQTFKLKASLKDHIVRCHVAKDPMYESKSIENDTGKLFPCDKCPKYSTTKHSLKVHQLTHTAEKAFACDQCENEKSFTLQVHQQRHHEANHATKLLKRRETTTARISKCQ